MWPMGATRRNFRLKGNFRFWQGEGVQYVKERGGLLKDNLQM